MRKEDLEKAFKEFEVGMKSDLKALGENVKREIEEEIVKRLAIEICRRDGQDPFGPTCDVYYPDDPDAIYPWAGYRSDARKLLDEARKARGGA